MFGGAKPALPPRRSPDQSLPGRKHGQHRRHMPEDEHDAGRQRDIQRTLPGRHNPGGCISNAGANQLGYTWSVNGQPISQGPSLAFGGAGREPGTYTVKVAASGGNFNPASARLRSRFANTGLPRERPGKPSSNPSWREVHPLGEFQGQCGGNIQPPTFEASEGTVHGDQFESTGVTFDSSNNAEQRKTVTITAKAADNKNMGTATTTVEESRAR